ncbi:hypothetical protein [Idiomarina sp. HP20-50]|uniref:hypothetical protein n=1 Tax=Idiomarina sp. HP20-50 TaxID=3070813 RepID=UPI00294B6503|nr:hypothetical protein [Idiomarina sp. HP20-50]MDV6316459.1 hypothetical protein [Idiomarina sp. HP20-50]
MTIKLAHQAIGSFSKYIERFDNAQSCTFFCRIISLIENKCLTKAGGEKVKANVVRLPVRTEEIEIKALAEVYNVFENFELEIFFTETAFSGGKNELLSALRKCIENDLVISAHSNTYSLLDGEMTLYNPALTLYEDKFSSLFL